MLASQQITRPTAPWNRFKRFTPRHSGYILLFVSVLSGASPLGMTPLDAQDAELIRSGSLLHSGGAATNVPRSSRPAATPNIPAATPADREAFSGLALPLEQASADAAERDNAEASGLLSSFLQGPAATIGGALAITLGLFCCFVAIMRRTERHGWQRGLPKSAMEIVGQLGIGPRQRLMVVRCGQRALVLGVSPAGIETVAEFTDSQEANHFLARCRGNDTGQAFRNTLDEMQRQPHAAGFVDSPDAYAMRSDTAYGTSGSDAEARTDTRRGAGASPNAGKRLFVRA